MSPGVIAGLTVAAALLIGWLSWRRWKRHKRSSIGDALEAVAVEHLQAVLLPDGMGGEIQLDHLLLTARGILVVDVKRYEGVVFASHRMDQWTVIGPQGRSTFPNPLANLYDRVAAVRQLVRNIEVSGVVVFPSQADFSKGRPDGVVLPEDLLKAYTKPDRADVGRLTEAFEPNWDKILKAVRPAAL